jgi:hypothetical protein
MPQKITIQEARGELQCEADDLISAEVRLIMQVLGKVMRVLTPSRWTLKGKGMYTRLGGFCWRFPDCSF